MQPNTAKKLKFDIPIKMKPIFEAKDALFQKWGKLNFSLCLIMKPDEVCLFSFLVNWEALNSKAQDHYFFCPTSTIEAHMGFHEQHQWRIFNSLRMKGFLTTEMRREDKIRRWIHINYDRIEAELAARINNKNPNVKSYVE